MTNQNDINHTITLIKIATTNIKRHQNAAASESTNRTHLIRELHHTGMTATQIADAVNLTRGRIHQILYPNGKPTPSHPQRSNHT